jgi:hypothetical protein
MVTTTKSVGAGNIEKPLRNLFFPDMTMDNTEYPLPNEISPEG